MLLQSKLKNPLSVIRMYRNKGKMNGGWGEPTSIFARRDITFLQSEIEDGHNLMD
jgi:hypothetical protein